MRHEGSDGKGSISHHGRVLALEHRLKGLRLGHGRLEHLLESLLFAFLAASLLLFELEARLVSFLGNLAARFLDLLLLNKLLFQQFLRFQLENAMRMVTRWTEPDMAHLDPPIVQQSNLLRVVGLHCRLPHY